MPTVQPRAPGEDHPSSRTASILLLMKGGSNRRYLEKKIVERYELVTDAAQGLPEHIDLIVCDAASFARRHEEIQAFKERHEPVVVPVLLVLPEAGYEQVIGRIWAVVDEAIRPPIHPGELFGRMRTLLRARGMSRKLARKSRQLNASRKRWQKLVLQSPEAIIVSRDGQILWVNPAGVELLEVDSAEDLVGHRLSEFIDAEQHGMFKKRLDRVQSGYPSQCYRYTVKTLHGRGRIVEAVSSPIHYIGQPAVQSIVRDVTDEVRAQRTLREREERLRTALRAARMCTWDWNLEEDRVTWSENREDILGDMPSRIGATGAEFLMLVHPDDRERLWEKGKAALKGDCTEASHTYRLVEEARAEWVESRFRIFRDESGRPLRVLGTTLDVTERKRDEQQIRKSERRYRLLAENVGDVIMRHTPEAVCTYASPSVEKLVGRSPEDVQETDVFTRIHPDDEHKVGTVIEELRVGEETHLAWRLRHSDGSYIWVETTARGVFDPDTGRMKEIVSVTRDISERKQAEEALEWRNRQLEAERRRLQTLVDALPVGVGVFDQNGGFVRYNPAFEEMWNSVPSIDEPEDYDQYMAWWPDTGERVQGDEWPLAQVLQGEQQSWVGELEIETFSGERKTTLMQVKALRDEDGAVNGGIVAAVDMTDQKKAERELRLLGRAIEQAAEAMIVSTPDGRIQYVNPAAAHMYGYGDPDELLGEPISVIYSEEEYHRQWLPLKDEVIGGDGAKVKAQHVRRDGTSFPVLMTLTALFDGERPEAFITTINDITEQKRYEDELIKARDEAEKMNRLKSEFLANMSHEIRTPLTGIIGMADVLVDEVREPHEEYMRLIEQNGKRLLETLTSVLDLSQLESDTFQLTPSRFDLAELAREAAALFRSKADEKGVALKVDTPEPIFVEMDRSAVNRVLSNLVSNAVKFTGEGQVEVAAFVDGRYAVLQVEDTGIGIEEDFLPHLFDEFKQASSGLTRQFEGSGLGMSITKKIVGLLGGTIDVSTEAGRGSGFTVRLPMRRVERTSEDVPASTVEPEPEPDPEEEPSAAEVHRTVLVVEDDASTQKVMELMLQNEYEVSVTEDMDGALGLAREQHVDLVILDVNLGERRTGIEVLRALKDLPGYEEVPIIAATAYAMAGDGERFLRAGFHSYVAKPLTEERLREAFEEAFNRDPRDVEAPEEESFEIELPPVPTTLPAILELAPQGAADTERLTEILGRDSVISSRVLQHVNSAPYSPRQKMSSIERAVTLLGFGPVYNLVLTASLTQTFSPDLEEGRSASIYNHLAKTSLAAAVFASKLAEFLEMEHSDRAFAAGMLMQVGRMALLGSRPEEYVELWFEEGEGTLTAPTLGQEFLRFGTDHVELGVKISRDWELPDEVEQVIRHQDRPHHYGIEQLGPLVFVLAAALTAAQNLYAPHRMTNDVEIESTSVLKSLEALARVQAKDVTEMAYFLQDMREEVRRFTDAIV